MVLGVTTKTPFACVASSGRGIITVEALCADTANSATRVAKVKIILFI